jgi:hypothetical protein
MHRKAAARVDTAVVSTRTDNVARRHLDHVLAATVTRTLGVRVDRV